jgi:2-oxoglutarate ferredoxin oxidoreductase subunit gamma
MVLSQAAALYENKNVVQTQSYGPESRGGASKCEVVISDTEIFYPKTMSLDVLLALTQEALDKNISRLKKGGVLIVDSFLVKNIPKHLNKSYSLPFTEIANQRLTNILVANMVALGALISITNVVNLTSLKAVMKERIKKKFWEIDEKALDVGFQEGKMLINHT